MSRLVLNSVFSYILVFAITLIVVGLAVGANCSRRVARVSGERRLPACSRRQLADDNRTQMLFGRLPKRAGKLPALPQNQSCGGSSSSSITRFNNRPAPPPSRLR